MAATHSNADCGHQQFSNSNMPPGKGNTAQRISGKPTESNAKQSSANADGFAQLCVDGDM